MKSRTLKFIALLLFILPAGLYILTVRVMMFPHAGGKNISPDMIMSLRLCATVLLLIDISGIALSYYAWIVKSSLTERVKNILLTPTTVLLMLLFAECFFLQVEESNAFGDRWSYKLWANKHLNKRVSFNYVDSHGDQKRADIREALPKADSKKKSIWFIGDSFTLGFGLAETAQTFPAIVEKLMKRAIVSFNLGDGGATTSIEKETLFAYDTAATQAPSAIVWQYLGNDIDVNDDGPDLYEKRISKNYWVHIGQHFFKAKSFLLDYLYWEYFLNNEQDAFTAYTNFLDSLYRIDSVVVNGTALKDSVGFITPYRQHLKPLQEAADYYKKRNIKFLVIVFPMLWQGGPEHDQQLYAQRLETNLRNNETDVINLAPLLMKIPAEERVANSHDPHPSAKVAQLTADTIANYFKLQYGW